MRWQLANSGFSFLLLKFVSMHQLLIALVLFIVMAMYSLRKFLHCPLSLHSYPKCLIRSHMSLQVHLSQSIWQFDTHLTYCKLLLLNNDFCVIHGPRYQRLCCQLGSFHYASFGYFKMMLAKQVSYVNNKIYVAIHQYLQLLQYCFTFYTRLIDTQNPCPWIYK